MNGTTSTLHQSDTLLLLLLLLLLHLSLLHVAKLGFADASSVADGLQEAGASVRRLNHFAGSAGHRPWGSQRRHFHAQGPGRVPQNDIPQLHECGRTRTWSRNLGGGINSCKRRGRRGRRRWSSSGSRGSKSGLGRGRGRRWRRRWGAGLQQGT